MGKNKVNDQEKLDQIDTGLSLDFIVGDSELSLSPLEVDVSISPVVNGPTTISPDKARTFDFAIPHEEGSKIEDAISGPVPSLPGNILLSSPFYNPSLSREVFSDFDTEDLPLLSLEVDINISPVVNGPTTISPDKVRTFDFVIPQEEINKLDSLPLVKKGKPAEKLEIYEDIIKSLAKLPEYIQLKFLTKLSLLQYCDYDAVKVLHKLIIENKDFFKGAPEELYDAIDPITMAYLNKSSKFEFNREKFVGSEITKLCKTQITQNLLKYVYLTRFTDKESIMLSIEKLIDGLEIVLKHDETNLVKTILTIATELNPIVFKFSQGKTDGYATVDGISITIGDKASTIYKSSETSNLDTLVHEYTHNVVGFLFDDKFDHRPYLLENPISKSQEDLEKAAKEDVSIKAHPNYGYLNEHYAREMIAYYVGEMAGKIHQKQTEGIDTGFSVTQSELFASWFEIHFLPVLNVYSKSGKADLSDILEDTFGSGKGLTDGLLSNSSQLVLDYLGFSDVAPVGEVILVES